jgi:hypothetical protein
MWQRAGTELATKGANLNAALSNQPANWVYPGAAAQGIPFTVSVNTLPDLTVAQLHGENPGVTLRHNTDPTGVIHCPDNAGNARYCAAFTENGQIYVATSELYDFNATGWEMENVILQRLGYDISGR